MATLHVENIPDDLYAKLQQLATSQNRSIDAQVITLLENALATHTPPPLIETTKSITEILEESRRRREQLPTDIEWPDSTAMIREDRDR